MGCAEEDARRKARKSRSYGRGKSMPSESDVRNGHVIVNKDLYTLDVFAQFASVVPVLLEWFWSAICKRSSSMWPVGRL